MCVSKRLPKTFSKLPLFKVKFHMTPRLISEIPSISNRSVRDSNFARPIMSSFCRTKKDAVFFADVV
jgi:hypothetical protein